MKGANGEDGEPKSREERAHENEAAANNEEAAANAEGSEVPSSTTSAPYDLVASNGPENLSMATGEATEGMGPHNPSGAQNAMTAPGRDVPLSATSAARDIVASNGPESSPMATNDEAEGLVSYSPPGMKNAMAAPTQKGQDEEISPLKKAKPEDFQTGTPESEKGWAKVKRTSTSWRKSSKNWSGRWNEGNGWSEADKTGRGWRNESLNTTSWSHHPETKKRRQEHGWARRDDTERLLDKTCCPLASEKQVLPSKTETKSKGSEGTGKKPRKKRTELLPNAGDFLDLDRQIREEQLLQREKAPQKREEEWSEKWKKEDGLLRQRKAIDEQERTLLKKEAEQQQADLKREVERQREELAWEVQREEYRLHEQREQLHREPRSMEVDDMGIPVLPGTQDTDMEVDEAHTQNDTKRSLRGLCPHMEQGTRREKTTAGAEETNEERRGGNIVTSPTCSPSRASRNDRDVEEVRNSVDVGPRSSAHAYHHGGHARGVRPGTHAHAHGEHARGAKPGPLTQNLQSGTQPRAHASAHGGQARGTRLRPPHPKLTVRCSRK